MVLVQQLVLHGMQVVQLRSNWERQRLRPKGRKERSETIQFWIYATNEYNYTIISMNVIKLLERELYYF